jgi:beta-glucosidase
VVATRGIAGAVVAWVLLGCSTAAAQEPWSDRSLPPDTRAQLLLSELTLQEKVALMHGDVWPDLGHHVGGIPPIPRVGFPGLRFTDGPAGIRQEGTLTTALPAPIALAATWDPALARRYGRVIGTEARATNNDVVLGPMVDVVRDPRAGRTFETFGEDPLLDSRLAAAEIGGIQEQGVMATAKHYVANTQETDRQTIDAIVDERTLRELYIPPFEAAVHDAHVAAVMGAYNRVNGTYNSQSCPLLTDTLRDGLGFDGFVVSDFDSTHGSAPDVTCGTDLEMPGGDNYRALLDDVTAGRLSPAAIDDSVRRTLRAAFASGALDRRPCPSPDSCFAVPLAADARVARAVAQSSIVLLKNGRRSGPPILPLTHRRVRTLAIVGPAADRIFAGGGSSRVGGWDAIEPSPRQALALRARRAGIRVRNAVAGPQAVAAARHADVAVVFVGDLMSEGWDRPCLQISCLGLTEGDWHADQLVQQVASANPRTVVVMQSGGPDVMDWADYVPAIIQGWYGGEAAGAAMAAALFGDADPAGRLPVTIPRSETDLATDTPQQFPGVDGRAVYSEGLFTGYRHFDAAGIAPRFAFGHGLSYTTFDYRDLRMRQTGPTILVSATITNTGARSGVETPQLYVGVPVPGEPPKRLEGFEKVRLAPGQSRTVRFALDQRALSYWDVQAHAWRVATGCYALLVGASSRDIRLRGRLGSGCRNATRSRSS